MVQPRMLSAIVQAECPKTLQYSQTDDEVCEHEEINFEQKKSNDAMMIRLKRELFDEILEFQQRKIGTETLPELMRMKKSALLNPKITVILNHFKRKTLCAQLNSLLNQTFPFHHVWIFLSTVQRRHL
ncbi:hypothetical protein KSP40_PGU002718 [Platanthera guangdongensis]|uniref:Uncharacterized protein n=1 Tax=Platanthera guangdongensis TaxID=2320717 RepID=A0ABR2MS13_9ASPA